MSVLFYNGVRLDLIQTQALDQSVVYDPSNTDYLYTKIRLRVQGIINNTISPATSGETPNQTMVRIRKCLLAPRQQLYYGTAGYDPSQPFASQVQNLLIVAPVAGFNVDSNNGPKPISCSITLITVVTYVVTYEIEVALYECCQSAALPYVSNRWTETHDLDTEGYLTRKIDGQVIFNSQYVNAKTQPGSTGSPIADNWRLLIAPPSIAVTPGYIRQSSSFAVTPDGLQLRYTITDKQQYAMIANFITRWEGTRRIEFKAGGGYSNEAITVRAWAPKGVPKANVYQACASTALRLVDSNKPIMSGSTSDNCHENMCEVTLKTISAKPGSIAPKGFIFPLADFPNQVTGIGGSDNYNLTPMAISKQLNMEVLGNYLGMCMNSSPTTNMTPQANVMNAM
jgi:hypothetical protein